MEIANFISIIAAIFGILVAYLKMNNKINKLEQKNAALQNDIIEIKEKISEKEKVETFEDKMRKDPYYQSISKELGRPL